MASEQRAHPPTADTALFSLVRASQTAQIDRICIRYASLSPTGSAAPNGGWRTQVEASTAAIPKE